MIVYLLVHNESGELTITKFIGDGYEVVEGCDEPGTYTLIDSWTE
jgi:hypothetical protein